VVGQRFYGAMPSLAQYDDDNPQQPGRHRLRADHSRRPQVDQYAATLASWFGVDGGGISDIFPNLGRFASSNLGFMS
jgi:uncharacterized protein (DUF1501 family)